VAAGIVLEETSPAIIESIQKKLRTILGGLPPPSLGREAAQDPTEFVLECERRGHVAITELIAEVGRDKLFAVLITEAAKASNALACLKAHIELKDARLETFMVDIEQASIEDLRDQYRTRQSKNARRPRPDALGELLRDILRDHPNFTTSQILKELERHENGPVIDTIDYSQGDGVIEWTDRHGTVHDTSITAIKDRLSRIRNSLKSSR